MTTTEGNRLIAEFMEFEIIGNDFKYPQNFRHLYHPYNVYEFESGDYNFEDDISGLQFHSSWGWLMLVVEKIWDITGNRSSLFYFKMDGNLIAPYEEHVTNILDSWLAVVTFISWYNGNK
jgi:hypothetical protein